MKVNDEGLSELSHTIQKEKQERIASGSIASDVLKRLNFTIDSLPQKCQNNLQDLTNKQIKLNIDSTDPIGLSLLHTENITQQMDQDYEILKLKQKNKELQAKIDRNNQFLKEIREELASSKDSLSLQSPNPENIQEHIRQLNQKVASYEESCDKANAKYSKLNIPEDILPASLTSLVASLSELAVDELSLRQRAEDVALARAARDTLAKLARG